MSNGKELRVGGRLHYHGWLIVREDEDEYLVFTPENADWPERGYEEWSTGILSEAKNCIDNYEPEDDAEA